MDIIAAAVDDLRGVLRLLLQLELCRFVVIGVIMTIAYARLYVVLRIWLDASFANALALGLLAPVNTQVNRRYTFGVRGRAGLLRQHATGALVYALALVLTEGALRLLHALLPHAARLTEVIVLVVASAAATLSRYVVLGTWVFVPSGTRGDDLRPVSSRSNSQHLAASRPSLPAPASYSPGPAGLRASRRFSRGRRHEPTKPMDAGELTTPLLGRSKRELRVASEASFNERLFDPGHGGHR